MNFIKNTYWKWREQKALRYIRESFACFGCDISDMNDDELRNTVVIASQNIAKMGFSVAELTAASKRLANTSPKIQDLMPKSKFPASN